MSNITNDQLTELIDETIAWACDLSERWTGTLHQKIIDEQQARLVKAVEENDLELAYDLVHHLAQTLEVSETEFAKTEG